MSVLELSKEERQLLTEVKKTSIFILDELMSLYGHSGLRILKKLPKYRGRNEEVKALDPELRALYASLLPRRNEEVKALDPELRALYASLLPLISCVADVLRKTR